MAVTGSGGYLGSAGVSGTFQPSGASGTVGNTAFTSIDPSSGGTYSSLLGELQNRLPGAPPSYQDLLTQGVNSPLLQTVLQPALQNLQSQFQLQNQQFGDEFRSAGALGSGAQAVGMGRLAQAQGNAQGNLIAQIISQMLPQFAQGLNQQYQNQLAVPGLLGSILGTAKPQVVQGRVGGVGGAGGAGGAGGDSLMNFGSDLMKKMGATSGNNPYSPFWNYGGFNDTYDPTQGLDLTGMGGEGGGGYDYGSYAGLGSQTPSSQPFDPFATGQYSYSYPEEAAEPSSVEFAQSF